MNGFFESMAQPIWRNLDNRVKQTMTRLRRSAKKIGVGLLCFQIAMPLLLIFALFFLAALFLELSHLTGFVGPALWSGLASFGGGLLFLLFGLVVLL